MKNISPIIQKITARLSDLGMALLMAMVLVILADIILRRFLNKPLSWSFEVISQLLVAVIFFALAYCTFLKGHVSIDTLVVRTPKRIHAALNIFGYLWGFVSFGLITWASTIYALEEMQSGYTTGILHMAIYPFISIVAFGSAIATLVLLFHLLTEIVELIKGR